MSIQAWRRLYKLVLGVQRTTRTAMQSCSAVHALSHWRGFLGTATISHQGDIRKGQHIHATVTCILDAFVTPAEANCKRAMQATCTVNMQIFPTNIQWECWDYKLIFQPPNQRFLNQQSQGVNPSQIVSSLVCKTAINKVWWQHQ